MKLRLSVIFATIKEILVSEKMPVWLTLLTTVMAASLAGLGTYYLAPAINASFEVQKAHAQYIMDNLKALNSDTADLFGSVGDVTETLATDMPPSKAEIYVFRRQVTHLQWRANEYETLFLSDKAKTTIKEYSENLSNLAAQVESARTKANIELIKTAAQSFALSSRELVKILSAQTRWSASFSLT